MMNTMESSAYSSFGSQRGRTGSATSMDSHGIGGVEVTLNDDSHHYDKSQECPSDIVLGKVSRNTDITDLIQKIGK